MADRMVSSMLVPVSPSGTGKTLTAFIASRCNSRAWVAAANACLRSSAVRCGIRTRRFHPIFVYGGFLVI